jgi:hypothetical protein
LAITGLTAKPPEAGWEDVAEMDVSPAEERGDVERRKPGVLNQGRSAAQIFATTWS